MKLSARGFGQPNYLLFKEKIMSKNQSSAQSAVEGELGLDDLEKIAGGTTEGLTLQPMENLLNVDSSIPVMAQTDSSYTSYFGAKGTAGNELGGPAALPMNLTNMFP